MSGLRNKKYKAQSTLELTIAFIVIIILLAGVVRLFIWFSGSVVGREKTYLKSYKRNIEKPLEFYHPPADIVPNRVYPESKK